MNIKKMTVDEFKDLLILSSKAMLNSYKGKWGDGGIVFDRIEEHEIDNVEFYFGFLDSEPDTIFLIYRGSDEWKDWKQNFKIWRKLKISNIKKLLLKSEREKSENFLIAPYENIESDIRVARGFIEDFFKVRSFVADKIKRYKILICMGHSKAHTLAAYTLLDRQYNNPDIKPEYNIGITEGGPRMGNKAFADSFDKRVPYFFRIVNGEDYVAKVPLSIQLYWHFGKLIHVGLYNPGCWIPVIRLFGNLYHYPMKYLKKVMKLSIKRLTKILQTL